MTPFEALYGKPPKGIQSYIPGSFPLKANDIELLTREDIMMQLK